MRITTTPHIYQTKTAINDNKTTFYYSKAVSCPFDTVNFKSGQMGAKQACQILMTGAVGALGLIQFLPKFVQQKLLDYRLNDYKDNMRHKYGSSKKREINSDIVKFKEVLKRHPDRYALMEKLLRYDVFSPSDIDNLNHNDDELFNLQMEYCDKMSSENKYRRLFGACFLHSNKTNNLYSKEDIKAKLRMYEYMMQYNKEHEKTKFYLEKEKTNMNLWHIGMYQNDIINSTNAFNEDFVLEMVKTKTTFIDELCPEGEIEAADIAGIARRLTPENIDYIKKMFRDKTVPKNSLLELSGWIKKDTMSEYKKLRKNPNIPKEFIGRLGGIINDYNRDFVMGILQGNKISRKYIAEIGECYNEFSAPVLKYFVKHIDEKRVYDNQELISKIGEAVNEKNQKYLEKLVKNNKVDLDDLSCVAQYINKDNYELAEKMLADRNFGGEYKQKVIPNINSGNRKFIEKLYSEKKISDIELRNAVIKLAWMQVNTDELEFAKKVFVLEFYKQYGELMKECGMNCETKINQILNSLGANHECTIVSKENEKQFLEHIAANNNLKAENLIKTYNFSKYGKNGIPLKYSRKKFIKNLENILSGIKAEDKKTILDHFGIIDNTNDYDGIWNNRDMDKSKLISEKGRAAYDKLKTELDNFMLRNEVISGDKEFDTVFNGLIKGLPSFVPMIGKVQHSTHAYSVDIHTLKVLQDSMNNPLYGELSDESKVVLKISALLHDIGKRGNVRDPGHASKSADYVMSVLNSMNFKKDVNNRIIDIIENHHWFEGYNTGSSKPETVAVRCRLPEDFLIYQILAKSDLENVNEHFHLGVTGTKNQKEFDKYFANKMKPLRDAVDKIYQNANIIFHTKILNNGDKFPTKKFTLSNGEELEVKLLDLNVLPNDTNLESYGFPIGTTKENARFIVHMTGVYDGFEVTQALLKSPLNHSSWSTTLISSKNTETYCEPYGFIFDVNQENISKAYYKNLGSGCQKDINVFEDTLFDFSDKERKYVHKNLQKELRLKGIWLSDKEYAELFEYIAKKKYISAIRKDIKIGNRIIKSDTLVKCLEKSRDKLFAERHSHNEIVVINPKIQGIYVKKDSLYSTADEEIIRFAHKYNLPIILMR